MANCFVIGGGFAGLSAAVYLSRNNHNVTLIEASPKLGGRAYSFNFEKQNCIVDNGQHIMMGCYHFTNDFLKTIGTYDRLKIQHNLKITFTDRGGRIFKLDTGNVTYPFSILAALNDYDALTRAEKFSVVKLFLKIAVVKADKYRELTTEEFLKSNNQSQNSIDSLWEIIHVGTMNCKLNESSAELFIRVLKEIFFTVDESTKIVIPGVGLSDLYCEAAVEYLQQRKCRIRLSERLIDVKFQNETKQVYQLVTNNNEYTDVDYLIVAVPPYQSEAILAKAGYVSFPDFEYSPILNIHLWLNPNPFKEEFYGLINSRIDWVFNHGSHITLVKSAAEELVGLEDDKIIEDVLKELKDHFPEFESQHISGHLIIKEKRATFKPTINNTKARRELPGNFGNIVIAGDWTNTGLPATIEGAVKSGKFASDKVSELTKKNL